MHFRKSLLYCLGWLLASELLCLFLAFSFAIISAPWARTVSLIFGPAAHILLMGNAGKTAADRSLIRLRRDGAGIFPGFAVLLGFCTALPLWGIYALLWLNADSSASLNIFLLLNAPFIQLHRLLIDGKEPFSAVVPLCRLLMGLPPFITWGAVTAGFLLSWLPGRADHAVQTPEHNSR